MTNPDPDLLVRVARKWTEAENIVGLELVASPGDALPGFTAGSHIDVHLPGGLVRQYSLVNAPASQGVYEIGVLRDPASRGGSSALHDTIGVGDILPIGGPRNHFPLVEGAHRSVLVARGIGVTPILAMAERLHALGSAFDLHYVTRTAARMAYADRLRETFPRERIHLYHEETGSGLELASILASGADTDHLYVCGGPAFIDAVRGEAIRCGWSGERVHFEYFANEPIHSPDDGSFDVVVNSTGQVVRVGAQEAITDALERVGVNVEVSCMQGVCGTCLTRVIEGDVDHRDLYLSPAEQASNDRILPCCSRATGPRLVLDL